MPNSVPHSTPTPPPPSPLPHSRLARSHNRRFHVRFPGVDSEEHLLNYYSCALVADILLQGHLYITENFFAFYSNIFGRKTQILLPVGDVIKVTKERTAKIIPNAVGLYTVEGKYVFGSLLSRNTTYRLMHHVWLKSADPVSIMHQRSSNSCNATAVFLFYRFRHLQRHAQRRLSDTTEEEPTATDASEPATSDEALVEEPPPPALEEAVSATRRLSRRKSEIFPRISAQAAARRQTQVPPIIATDSPAIVEQITLSKCGWDCTKPRDCFTRLDDNVQTVNNGSLPRSTLFLLAATLLLVMLFLLATVLVYRVSIATSKTGAEDSWPMRSGHRLTSYLELLKQQQEAVEEEILRITSTLKNRLNDLRQVKQSIDQLSTLTRRTTCSSAKETSGGEN